MTQSINTSWQERYHASEIYTLRCKIHDIPGMFGRLAMAIGQAGAHVGTVKVVSIDRSCKVRDVTVFCADKQHLNKLLATLADLDGIEVISQRNEVEEIHRRGTIKTVSRVKINNLTDLRMVYTPGVASVCNKIVSHPQSARELTGICDRVAIVTNGTAVLGLGDIGVLPSLPVMEGKAAIFAEFVNISADPILVDTTDINKIIETVCLISKAYGAIQLEDIAAPACFTIEETLREKLNIPVFHDDQHGTATVVLASLINALKQTGKTIDKCTAIILGAGAAGIAITDILLQYGIKDVVVYDSAGAIYEGRKEKMNPYKQRLAQRTNRNMLTGPLARGFKNRDIFIGVARPNMVTKDMIKLMNPNPIVLPLSNPVGEITIEDALDAGAAFAADGRTINNALAYPGLFRGALDVKATAITVEMQLAAARELARLADTGSVLPDIMDKLVHQHVAKAVADAWQKNHSH